MTARERVFCTLAGGKSDKVPIYQAGFSGQVASQILGRHAYVGGGHAQYLEAVALWNGEEAHEEYLARCWQDAVDLCRMLRLDVVRTTYWRLDEKPTRRLDEVTFFYGDEASSWRVMRYDPVSELYQVVDASPQPEPTLEDFERMVVASEEGLAQYEPSPALFADLLRAMDEFGDDGVPYGGGGVWLCIPREAVWLEAVALRPDLVGRYLDVQAEQSVRNARLAAQSGIVHLYGGGDFATAKGPLYSPRSFHELMLPRLQRISAVCDEIGSFHGFGSDGNLWSVAEDLFGASGIRFFYELDVRAGMDMATLRRRFPHVALMGGISSETLHQGTVEDVVRETREALEAAHEYGGCVVGCSNQIVAGTPMANFWAMMETLEAER